MTLWPSSLVRWPWNFTWIFFVKYLTITSYICVYKNFLVSEIFREQIYNPVLRAVPDDCTCLKLILVSVDSLDLNQQILRNVWLLISGKVLILEKFRVLHMKGRAMNYLAAKIQTCSVNCDDVIAEKRKLVFWARFPLFFVRITPKTNQFTT